jgi:REP element-mobilizing transposase RayT
MPGYDYAAPGYYFVTVCLRNHEPLLGWIDCGAMSLSKMGLIVEEEWCRLPERFPAVRLDEFVVMPNHIHGVVEMVRLVDTHPSQMGSSQHVTLGCVVGTFKSLTDRRCRQTVLAGCGKRFGCLWQRNFYDHVITGQNDLGRIRNYIRKNPETWLDDRHFVSR